MKKEKKEKKEADLRREVGTRKSPRQHDVKVFYKESSSEEETRKVGVSFVNPAPSRSSV